MKLDLKLLVYRLVFVCQCFQKEVFGIIQFFCLFSFYFQFEILIYGYFSFALCKLNHWFYLAHIKIVNAYSKIIQGDDDIVIGNDVYVAICGFNPHPQFVWLIEVLNCVVLGTLVPEQSHLFCNRLRLISDLFYSNSSRAPCFHRCHLWAFEYRK